MQKIPEAALGTLTRTTSTKGREGKGEETTTPTPPPPPEGSDEDDDDERESQEPATGSTECMELEFQGIYWELIVAFPTAATALKSTVGHSTSNAYIASVVDLYKVQVHLNINSHPHPRIDGALKKLVATVCTQTAQRK